ncbi:2-oxo-4-hydroxy-4-carboxy-5-ureidoimidazoline decarboxylase [Cellulomonas sp. P5_C6]
MISDDAETRSRLATALHVARWVDEVAAGCPYPSVDPMIGVADLAARSLTAAEVDEALSAHPRIGEKAGGLSRSEQAASTTDDPALVEAMTAGNRAYEERFGRIFLIRAAGRTRPEILESLQHRLTLSDDAELAEVADQLRQIALLRLRTLFAPEESA